MKYIENRRYWPSLQIKSLGWLTLFEQDFSIIFFFFPPNLSGFVTLQKSLNRDWALKSSAVWGGGVILFNLQGNYENQWGKIHKVSVVETMDCFPKFCIILFFLIAEWVILFCHMPTSNKDFISNLFWIWVWSCD